MCRDGVRVFTMGRNGVSQMFMWVEGISGDFRHHDRPGWMELASYSPGGASRMNGSVTRQQSATPPDVVFVKYWDSASPRLFMAAMNGIQFPTVLISMAGPNYLVSYADVLFTSYSPGNLDSGARRATDSGAFVFGSVNQNAGVNLLDSLRSIGRYIGLPLKIPLTPPPACGPVAAP